MAPRRDAQRNREQLLDAARRAFAGGDDTVALDAIARDAGVGIATLYRHFPRREDLVEAVYRGEISRLQDAADTLLAAHPPAVALRRWMGSFGDYVTTKRGMAQTLRAVVASGAITRTATRQILAEAVGRILTAGVAAGDLRPGVEPLDVVIGVVGLYAACDLPDDRPAADRVCDLLVAGLRREGWA